MRNHCYHHYFKLLIPEDSQGSNMLYPLTPGFTSSHNYVKPSDPPWQQERTRIYVLGPHPGTVRQTHLWEPCPPHPARPHALSAPPLHNQNLTANHRRDRKHTEQCPIAQTGQLRPPGLSNGTSCIRIVHH